MTATVSGKTLDVICLGRASVDLYGQQIGDRLQDISSFAKSLGGSSCNIAFGAARLALMAATGAGVAVLPDLFARRQAIHRKEVVVRPLDMPDANRGISLLFSREQPLDDNCHRLVGIIRTAAKSLDLAVSDL